MHYLAHSITKLCQSRKQWYEGWGAFQCMTVLGKKVYLSLFLSVGSCLYAREWMCLDCLRFGVR